MSTTRRALQLAAVILVSALLVVGLPSPSASAEIERVTVLDIDGVPGSSLSMVLSAAGNPRIVYHDRENSELRVAICADPACANYTTRLIDDGVDVAVDGDIAMALSPAGYPVITYQDSSNFDLKIARCSDADCVDVALGYVDRIGVVGRTSAVVVTPSDLPVVFYTEQERDLWLAICGDPMCTTSTKRSLEPDGGNTWVSLDLDALGNPRVIFSPWFAAGPTIVRCLDVACVDVSTQSFTNDGVIGNASVVIDSADRPVTVYGKRSGVWPDYRYSLEIRTCSDPACSATSSRELQEVSVGQVSNIVIHPTGELSFAFDAFEQRELRLVTCADSACLTPTIRVIETEAVGISSPSLMLDANDEPVLAYADLRNQHLKFAGPCPANEFGDVNSAAYFAAPVAWAACNEITTGTSPTTFEPNATVTRGQLATFLWRHAGEPVVDVSTGFDDVPAGAYFEQPVAWMAAGGITNGTSPTEFSPAAPVTRGQLATFLWRYAGSPAVDSGSSFSDVPVGAFYETPVAWLASTGVTTGTTPTTFSPDAALTRGEAVTFLYRFDAID